MQPIKESNKKICFRVSICTSVVFIRTIPLDDNRLTDFIKSLLAHFARIDHFVFDKMIFFIRKKKPATKMIKALYKTRTISLK